jgi:hypothetical protein
MAAFGSFEEHEAMNSSTTTNRVEHEEGPGKRQGGERPEIAVPTLPDGSTQEQGAAEIQPVPAKPELAPVPERLKN